MTNRLVRLLVFVCTSLAAAAASAQGPQRDIVRAARPIRDQYIVLLAGADDPQAVGLETATLFGGRLKHVYERAVRGFAIQLPEAAAARLADDPRVRLVEEDGVVQVTDLQSSPPWGLDRIDQRMLPLNAQYSYTLSATPVYVHVIDTGIRVSHLEFGGRAFIGGDYVTPSTGGLDCNGHGTHVAATIGGVTYGVAKNVTLYAQRVLDCSGYGSNASVIAALDAIATDTAHRPSVANMSLAGPASLSLDAAVRGAIASGVTVVVAAGNSNVDASTQSPARVTEAITVGATGSNDGRASFSNFGSVVDLFAPGVSVLSAWYTSDTASATASGTSMAAPHVAGAIALYLEGGNRTPSQVASALIASATPGVVGGPGVGSPNLLLYTRFGLTAPVVSLTQPNGNEKLYTATPYTIAWTASDADGLAGFDVLLSINGGASYGPIAECSGLPGSARQCIWSAPGGVTSTALIKVLARDTLGDQGADISDGKFSIIAGAASVTVTSPNAAINWGRGSIQPITWSHNLGSSSYVRIELSRDGGLTFPELLAANVKSSSSSNGTFNWRVTGPNAALAVVRVTWVAGPTADVSNIPFTIADPYITATTPSSSSTSWGYGSTQTVKWTTNLGPLDTVALLLSTDGGNTFPLTLSSSVIASAKSASVLVPTLAAATTAARVRVSWANAPSGQSAGGTTPANFRVEPPYVTLTLPNGGETWVVGTTATVKWTSNMGGTAKVNITLSTDGGATYPTVIAANTPNDGAETVTVSSVWATSTARVRVTSTVDPAVADTSNASFVVQ
jgi:subtilisin family serine protease